MEYTEIKLTLQKSISEDTKGIYISDLGDLGFDSFSEEGNLVMAYIPSVDYHKNIDEISTYLKSIPNCNSEMKIVADQNWNALWESNFDTIIVNDKCAIRAPFHEPLGYDVEIVIMPRMAFGTGHHQTTQLMIDEVLNSDMQGKMGLDMGSGTGILAIAAVISGASYVDAVDIDEWAYDNITENTVRNSVDAKISSYLGDASLFEGEGILAGQTYDFILANINRNILLRDMPIYLSRLKSKGEILFSGFLESDVDILKDKAGTLGLTFAKVATREKWYMLKFIKE